LEFLDKASSSIGEPQTLSSEKIRKEEIEEERMKSKPQVLQLLGGLHQKGEFAGVIPK